MAKVGGPHIHFSNETGKNSGRDLELECADAVLVTISGTPATTGLEIRFLASVGGPFQPIRGTRLTDGLVSDRSYGVGETWYFPVTGFEVFRVEKRTDGGQVTVQSIPIWGISAQPLMPRPEPVLGDRFVFFKDLPGADVDTFSPTMTLQPETDLVLLRMDGGGNRFRVVEPHLSNDPSFASYDWPDWLDLITGEFAYKDLQFSLPFDKGLFLIWTSGYRYFRLKVLGGTVGDPWTAVAVPLWGIGASLQALIPRLRFRRADVLSSEQKSVPAGGYAANTLVRASSPFVRILVQNDPSNTGNLIIVLSQFETKGIVLRPGDREWLEVGKDNVVIVYNPGTAPQLVNYLVVG